MITHEALSALIKDEFYDARDHGRTMHQAADAAAEKILGELRALEGDPR